LVVTPLGVDSSFSPRGEPRALTDGRDYVLHVGAHDTRKQTGTLIAAWERAFPQAQVALVFTRRPPQLPRRALVLDAPDDAGLVALYRGAALVAVPSVDEGFGLPLLEALACGTPVLAARAGALPEIGAEAAAYVEPVDDVDAWANALRALYDDAGRRRELATRGPARAALFSWARCTALTLTALRLAAWS
jgi:glycosyltransferase involved in cell wall biosynthesis